jgi:hypothetical protein
MTHVWYVLGEISGSQEVEINMAALTIRSGLRKLEFISFGDDAETAEARVEFARESPLPEGERVQISLGMREGKLRSLVGVPLLLERSAAASRTEYRYRLHGQITERSA